MAFGEVISYVLSLFMVHFVSSLELSFHVILKRVSACPVPLLLMKCMAFCQVVFCFVIRAFLCKLYPKSVRFLRLFLNSSNVAFWEVIKYDYWLFMLYFVS